MISLFFHYSYIISFLIRKNTLNVLQKFVFKLFKNTFFMYVLHYFKNCFKLIVLRENRKCEYEIEFNFQMRLFCT